MNWRPTFKLPALAAHRLETWLQGAGSVRLFPVPLSIERAQQRIARAEQRARLSGLETLDAMEAEHRDFLGGALTLFLTMVSGLGVAIGLALHHHEAAAGVLAVVLHTTWTGLQVRPARSLT